MNSGKVPQLVLGYRDVLKGSEAASHLYVKVVSLGGFELRIVTVKKIDLFSPTATLPSNTLFRFLGKVLHFCKSCDDFTKHIKLTRQLGVNFYCIKKKIFSE